MISEERDQILKMVESGDLSATEAAELLAVLEDNKEESAASSAMSARVKREAQWEAPVIAGIVVSGFGLLGLMRARNAGTLRRIGALLTLFLGLVALVIGIWSRNAPWLHVDVRERDGNTIRVRLPLLLPLARPLLDLARGFVDADTARQLDNAGAFIDALQRGEQQEPFRVEVDDGDGNNVVVYVA